MKQFFKIVIAALIAIPTALIATNLQAESETSAEPPSALEKFNPLLGRWKGQAEFSQPGDKTRTLSVKLDCEKVSRDWGILCEMSARSSKMAILETNLIGIDPATGSGHWYTVNNLGETQDHVAEWLSPTQMKASTSWTENGKQMHENMTLDFTSESTFDYRSVVTADGEEVRVFSWKLMR